MDLWIRSQDKEILMKVDNINLGIDVDTKKPNRLFTFVDGVTTSFTLGKYKSKERAIEILDEIQSYLINNTFAKKINGLGEIKDVVPNPLFVYQMPKE